MSLEAGESLAAAAQQVQGYIYPNDLNLWWSVVIVVYPYITGLVAGAFILASLVRVFHVQALEPTYRFSLLAALAFLLVAPLPLLVHLGHPERCYEVLMTPHLSSPMAVFGFVYAWYLMAVLLLELWFDYRQDFVAWSVSDPNPVKRLLYRIMTLGVTDVSEQALSVDHRLGQFITVVGIPSAFLLHGYVGFIFGSIKANPWWGTVLMPIIFIFSAMVSGIALMGFLYQLVSKLRRAPIQISCVDAINKSLFFMLIVDASIETLDWVHRLYEAEESLDVLVLLAAGKLFYSFLLVQVLLGTVVPLVLLAVAVVSVKRLQDGVRRTLGFISCLLVVIGVFAMRWNVVIGGQLFSKSLRGFTTYKLGLIGSEGLLMAVALLILPFIILGFLVYFFKPWREKAPDLTGA
jgi:Ni/Fe-hydrogenase subunit HybB-like protein